MVYWFHLLIQCLWNSVEAQLNIHRIEYSFVKSNMFNKSDFILKIPGAFIDCMLRN